MLQRDEKSVNYSLKLTIFLGFDMYSTKVLKKAHTV